VYHCGAGI